MEKNMEIFKPKNIKDLIKRFGLRATAKLEHSNAKELPGFDIEIGEELSKNVIDTSKLLHPRWKISQETREIFIETFRRLDIQKVHSEWLLDVKETTNPLRVIRNYHSPHFLPRGNGYHFPSLANVWINSRFILLRHYGEGPDDYSGLDSYFEEQLNQTNCWARINGRELEVTFNETGAISQIIIGNKPKNFSIIDKDKIQLLCQRGTLSLKGTQDYFSRIVSTDNILLIVEDGRIILERFKRDDLEHPIDKVVMPIQIDRKGILSILFDPRTLKDPINAPPELDRWYLMNSFEVCGITWGQKPEGNKRKKI